MSLSDQIRGTSAAVEGQKALTGTGLAMGQISAAVKEMALDQNLRGDAGKVDLSKHTEPCRQYLAGANSE